MNSATAKSPPHDLEGVQLPSGWRIGPELTKQPGSSGGYFSVGYTCTDEHGRTAFLKAIDLYKPLSDPTIDVIAALQPLLQGAQGEKDLLQECKGMDRVVTTIESGDIRELHGASLQIPIPYIIFEQAEATARGVLFAPKRPSHGWYLRTLQQVAVGLGQMHGRVIAHQDLKLSNILIFKADRGAKVSDLGRSVQQGRSVPHDQLEWPGDWGYAPPEFSYGYTAAEFNARRLSADLYLLGSCACAIFTRVAMNALLYDALPKIFWPVMLGGIYAGTFENALPHLNAALEIVLQKLQSEIPAAAPYRDAVVAMVRQWCDPNPHERGHPRTRAVSSPNGNMYDLQRYITELDVLAQRALIYDIQSRA